MNELVFRYLDGVATEPEVAELSALLRGSESARTAYLQLAAVHARLATDPGLWAEPVVETATIALPVSTRKTWVISWLASAACAAALLAVLFWPRSSGPVPSLATLLTTDNAQWVGSQRAEGSRLSAGPLELRSGAALVRMDGGATLLLEGPLEMLLESGGSVRLLSGKVRAQVPEEAIGFTIHAPGGDVVDLGTEFVAHVNDDAATSVTVVEGEVEVHPSGQPGELHTLTTGAALELDRRGKTRDIAAAEPPRALQEVVRGWPNSLSPQPLLLHENFSYPAGDYPTGTLNGGEGWNGPWQLCTDAAGNRTYSGTSRTMQIEASEGQGAWLSPAGKNSRQRRLSDPVDLSRDGVHYVSLRWVEAAQAERSLATRPGSGLSLLLLQHNEVRPGRIGLRMDQLLRPRIETGMGQGFVSRVKAEDGKRLLLVAKILSRAQGDDEVSLRVFAEGEDPGAWEPDTWDIVSRGLRLDAVLDCAELRSSGPLPRRIEEIRVGTSWRHVVTQP